MKVIDGQLVTSSYPHSNIKYDFDTDNYISININIQIIKLNMFLKY